MQRMNKKGDLEFDVVLKLVIALIVLLIIVGIIFLFRGKSVGIIEKIRDIMRFGA